MGTKSSSVCVTPPVAGLSLIHELASTMRFGDWTETESFVPDTETSIYLRHRAGATSVTGLTPLIQVNSGVTYYSAPNGPVVCMEGIDPAAGTVVLRTVRAGYEYTVDYAPGLAGPVSHRGPELSAFALSIGARRHGVMAHGCGVILSNGMAALCLGASGAGKSTLARMLRAVPGVTVLNDDRLVVTCPDKVPHLWSTPWPGSAGIAHRGDAPLGVVAIIGRAVEPTSRLVDRARGLRTMLSTILLPLWNPPEMSDALLLMDTVARQTPLVELAYPLGSGEWVARALEAACQ